MLQEKLSLPVNTPIKHSLFDSFKRDSYTSETFEGEILNGSIKFIVFFERVIMDELGSSFGEDEKLFIFFVSD